MNEQVDKLTKELDSRLDELFSEDGLFEDEPKPPAEPDPDPKPAPNERRPDAPTSSSSGLADLDALLMSVEWEIDDHVMGTYLTEIERLRNAARPGDVMVYYLKILQSLGDYIRKEKAAAHPDSIRLLKETQESLGRLLADTELDATEKKAHFLATYDRFDAFRKVIGCRPRSSQDWDRETLVHLIRKVVREELEAAGSV